MIPPVDLPDGVTAEWMPSWGAWRVVREQGHRSRGLMVRPEDDWQEKLALLRISEKWDLPDYFLSEKPDFVVGEGWSVELQKQDVERPTDYFEAH